MRFRRVYRLSAHIPSAEPGDDPLTFSIANGLAFGTTAYALPELLRGRITRTDRRLLVLAALFVARFVWLSAG